MRFVLGLIGAIWVVLSGVSANAETVAFAKYGPLLTSSEPDLSGLSQTAVQFGEPLTVISQLPGKVEIEVGGQSRWAHRADLMVTDAPRFAQGGDGFRTAVRPGMKFWQALAPISEFLSLSDVSNASPDYLEIVTDTRSQSPKYPVLAVDYVDVMGRSFVPIANVYLPIRQDLIKVFDAKRGEGGLDIRVTIVADVSPDTAQFTIETAGQVIAQLRRRFSRTAARVEFQLLPFGIHLWSRPTLSETEQIEVLSDAASLYNGGKLGTEEPLLPALHAAWKRVTNGEGPASQAILVMSGPDIEDNAFISGGIGNVTLQSPSLKSRNPHPIVIVQAAPEPGHDLQTLSVGLRSTSDVTLIDYSDKVATDAVASIVEALDLKTETPLAQSAIAEICAVSEAGRFPCVLPIAPSDQSAMPRPSLRARDSGAEWFVTPVWTVIDGIILELSDDQG